MGVEHQALIQAAIVALGAHVVVGRMEEPPTRKRLGAEYEEDCRSVPRWIPRFRRARAEGKNRTAKKR